MYSIRRFSNDSGSNKSTEKLSKGLGVGLGLGAAGLGLGAGSLRAGSISKIDKKIGELSGQFNDAVKGVNDVSNEIAKINEARVNNARAHAAIKKGMNSNYRAMIEEPTKLKPDWDYYDRVTEYYNKDKELYKKSKDKLISDLNKRKELLKMKASYTNDVNSTTHDAEQLFKKRADKVKLMKKLAIGSAAAAAVGGSLYAYGRHKSKKRVINNHNMYISCIK